MKTILIVDDDASNIDLLAFLLMDDYKIMTAESGEEAIEAALTQTPDLVLLDVQMPGIDGYQTCLKLKENNATKNCQVIFVSGNDSEDEKKKGYEVGAVDYIVKPINPKEVRQKVGLNMVKNSLEPKDEAPIVSEMLDGDSNLEELIKNLIDELPSWLGDIKQSFHDKDWVETKRKLHMLKGTAGSFFKLSTEELSALITRVVKGRPD